jgi:hypothetical protein
MQTQIKGGAGVTNILLSGPPGCGKSNIVEQWSAMHNLEYDLWITGNTDCIDIGGAMIPNFKAQTLDHMNTERIVRPPKEGYDGRVIFLDEIGNCTLETGTALLTPLASRTHEGRNIRDDTFFVAATNREEDNTGSTELSQALKSRFFKMDMLPNAPRWIDWAYSAGIDRRIIGCIHWKNSLLHEFDAESKEFGQANPRAWEQLSTLLHFIEPDEIRFAACEVLGHSTGNAFVGFCELEEQLATMPEILSDPDGCRCPDISVSAHYATVTNIAWWCANEKNEGRKLKVEDVEAIITYVRRMPRNIATFGFDMIDKASDGFANSGAKAYGTFVADFQSYSL